MHINAMHMSIFYAFPIIEECVKEFIWTLHRNLFEVKSKMMYDNIYITFGTKEKKCLKEDNVNQIQLNKLQYLGHFF